MIAEVADIWTNTKDLLVLKAKHGKTGSRFHRAPRTCSNKMGHSLLRRIPQTQPQRSAMHQLNPRRSGVAVLVT